MCNLLIVFYFGDGFKFSSWRIWKSIVSLSVFLGVYVLLCACNAN